MPRFSADQLSFAARCTGYLDRDLSIDFLKRMDIRMSVAKSIDFRVIHDKEGCREGIGESGG